MRPLLVAFAVASIGILGAGCSNGSKSSTTTTTTRTTTTTIAPPVAEDALKKFLLSPEQINAAMGATGMTVMKRRDTMSDDSATMQPKECLAIDGSAQARVYADSGFTAERDQTLQEGDTFTHFAEQAVVRFSTAKQARAFYTASAKQWPACHQYTHIQSGSQWSAGPISDANGTLSTIATQNNAVATGWACGRALTTTNNIVIDINTCSADPKDSAVVIAHQIAAKVPTK